MTTSRRPLGDGREAAHPGPMDTTTRTRHQRAPLPLWERAEHEALHHVRSQLDIPSAKLTHDGAGTDGGIDVSAHGFAAQVKCHGKPTAIAPVRELRGAAHQHRTVVFYSASGYAQGVAAKADALGVACFHLVIDGRGGAVPCNRMARDLLADVAKRRRASDGAGQDYVVGVTRRPGAAPDAIAFQVLVWITCLAIVGLVWLLIWAGMS